jgi:PAS domain S-box-containing protein
MVLGVDLFFSLFNNLAIFIALVGVYGYLIVQLKPSTWYKRQFLLGLTFGLFAIGCMYAKIPVFEGVIVDQRNAIIALSGFFGGPLAAYLSAAFAGAFRLYLGGQGALAGVIGVTLAATSGVLLSRRNKPFGSVPRAATSAFLATLFILPGFLFVKDFQTGLTLLKSMSAPYGLAIFLGIFIVGLLLHREDNKIELEQLLHDSEERFQKMFREHTAVMLLIDPEDGNIVDANQAACEYYGYTREQLVSLSIGDINTLSHGAMSAMQQAKGRRDNYFEFKHRLASGEVRDIESYSSPIIVNSHPLLFSIIHDITERNRAEEELVRYRDQLEVLVDEQTEELKKAHARLLQRERLTALGKLTATVSHELRNPLGTIQTALHSIEDSLERKEVHQTTRLLKLAERSIRRCINIIEDLNDYTRVKDLALSKASADDWLENVVKEQNIPEEISCELNLTSGVEASFDPERLRQVVINLFTNAVHALQNKPSGSKVLRISTVLLDDIFEICFEDNGIGMSEETKEQMFEPLFSTKGFGVGLGMVIVKNIIEQHRGEINVESKAGKGTTVTLRLPINLPERQRKQTI